MDDCKQTLWMFQYHLGDENIKQTTIMYLEFFYASDRQEAEQLRDAFIANQEELISPESLEPCEHGIMIARKFLPGKKISPS